MKILHFALDEHHTVSALKLFELAFPGCSRCVVISNGAESGRYVRPAPRVVYRSKSWFRRGLILWDLWGADMVVLHSAHYGAPRLLRWLGRSVKLVWIGWGYEYPELVERHRGVPTYAPLTQALLGDAIPPVTHPPPIATPLLTIAHRIDVAICHPADHEQVKAVLPDLRARFHAIPLYTVEDVFEHGPPEMAGNDVLLGNSAMPTNNHVDALQWLRARPIEGRVLAPLSRGGEAAYVESVERLGREWLGERFEPLVDWIPIDRYHQLLQTCGFVIMNHTRQQAVGTMGSCLYRGATLYLREANPLFRFYLGLGASVRAMDELDADPGAALRALSPQERQTNREVIGRYYSRKSVVAAIRELALL